MLVMQLPTSVDEILNDVRADDVAGMFKKFDRASPRHGGFKACRTFQQNESRSPLHIFDSTRRRERCLNSLGTRRAKTNQMQHIGSPPEKFASIGKMIDAVEAIIVLSLIFGMSYCVLH